MYDVVRYEKERRYSRIVVHNGTAYFSGLTAHDLAGDIRAQTREALSRADELLVKVKAGRSDLLSATIWLRDIEEVDAMNEIWEAWIDPDNPPLVRPSRRISPHRTFEWRSSSLFSGWSPQRNHAGCNSPAKR